MAPLIAVIIEMVAERDSNSNGLSIRIGNSNSINHSLVRTTMISVMVPSHKIQLHKRSNSQLPCITTCRNHRTSSCNIHSNSNGKSIRISNSNRVSDSTCTDSTCTNNNEKCNGTIPQHSAPQAPKRNNAS